MDRHRGRETWWRFPIRLWKRRVSWSAKRCRWRIYISGPAVARPPIRMCDLPIRICKRWYGSDIALPSYIPPGRSRCVVNSSEEIGEPSQMLRPITWLFVSQCPICKADVTQPLQKFDSSESSAEVDAANIITPPIGDSQPMALSSERTPLLSRTSS